MGVILRLVFCFPLGLYIMWTRTRWPRVVKVAVSGLIAFALVVIMTPFTNPPERQSGGIVLVGAEPQVEVLGPEAPADRQVVEIYAPRRTAIIVEATATPEPIYVYCNNGGRYYHAQDCRYVVETTPKVSLSQAVKAGYVQCPDCDAPSAALVS